MPKFAIKYKGTSEDESGQTVSDFTNVVVFNAVAIAFSFGIKGMFNVVFKYFFTNARWGEFVSYLIYNTVLLVILILMYRGLNKKAEKKEVFLRKIKKKND